MRFAALLNLVRSAFDSGAGPETGRNGRGIFPVAGDSQHCVYGGPDGGGKTRDPAPLYP